jgi:oxygen-independent coproporphyrinogen-3 oxidase
MILQMKKGYLDVGYFDTKYDDSIVDRWQSEWNGLVSEGFAHLIEGDDGRVARIELTMDGLLCVDGLLPRFFEESLRGVRYT